ncbi:MAG: Gfo/Idh/MocA family protein [Acidimicrobiia bacterium]
MSVTPVRVGIVGCGRLAERGYLPALSGLDAIRLVAVADPDGSRRAAVVAAAGPVATYGDAAELLDGTEVDGLLVASPVARHVADATLAAEAGVVALVEKPPAADAATAAVLGALSPAPFLGFNRRFDGAALAARSGVHPLGDVELDLALRYRRRRWAAHAVVDDAMLDLGPHLVDWARWISGREVRSVAAEELSTDRAVLRLALAGGRARLEAATNRPHEERLRLRVDGRRVTDHRVGGAAAGLAARLPLRRSPDRLVGTLRAELAAFAHALRTGCRGALGTPADGVAVMAVLDAARASAATGGRRIDVPTPDEVAP